MCQERLRDLTRQTRRLLDAHPELPVTELSHVMHQLSVFESQFAEARHAIEHANIRSTAAKQIEMAEMAIAESRRTIACK